MRTELSHLACALGLTLLCAGAARADITNNLALYLRLDETNGLSAADSGPNGLNGTLIGFPGDNSQWVTNGRFNGAIRVNPPGGTNYVSVADNAALNFATVNALTISAWVMSSTTQLGGSSVICKGTGGGSEQYNIDINGGKFRFFIRNSGGAANPVTSTLGPTANFQHVVGVYDGTNKVLRIYVNGQLNASLTNANNSSLKVTAHELTIGARQSAAAAYNLPFVNGVIDDVRIFGRALSPSDVFELYADHGKAPIISAPPRSYTCNAGDVAAFAVGADTVNSIVPLSYQWQLGGTNIPGATTSTLAITNVSTAQSGQSVSVTITNVIGTNVSTPVLLTVVDLPPADITNGLVAHYKFDDAAGSTVAADATLHANPAALINFSDYNACWTNGLISGALAFNADSSAINLLAVTNVGAPTPDVLEFSTGGTFTLAAWVNGALTQTNGGAVFAKGNGGGGEQFSLDMNGGRYRFYIRNASGAVSTVQTTVAPNNTWQQMICVVNTSNGVMNVYVNGLLAGEAIAPLTLLSNVHEISIGNRQSGSGAYNLPWTGLIDDVRFYNRSFTAADAQALYLTGGVYPPAMVTAPTGATLYVGDNFRMSGLASGTFPLAYQWYRGTTLLPGATNTVLNFLPTVASNAGNYTLVVTNAYGAATSAPAATLTLNPFGLTDALALNLKFDDGTNSSMAVDASTNGNNGSLTGFPDYTSEWITGRIGGGLSFNSTPGVPVNQYVSVPDSSSLNFDTVSNFSLSVWVRGPAAQVSGAGIIAKGYGSLNEEYALDVSGGFYRFYVRNAASASTALVSPVAPNGLWQHIVATYDGAFTTMNLYVNGALVATTAAAPPTLLADNGHEVSIGNREQTSSSGYNFDFVGSIDDVRIYSRTLSSNDVQTLFQAAGNFAPVFYTQPTAGANLYVGDNLTLVTLVDGSTPLGYQWLKNNTNISSATNASYAITNAQLGDAGTYFLVVSNAGGQTISITSLVNVVEFNITNTAAHLPFDETTGLGAADASGNGNVGALVGFVGDDSQWTPGRTGGGLTFNANQSSGEVVTIADSVTLNFSNKVSLTLAAWVRGTPTQANGAGLITKGAGAGGEQYAMDVHVDQLSVPAYRFYVRNAAGVSTPMPTLVAPNGRWQHLVATFDGNAGLMSFYVNAQLVATVPAPPSLLVSTHEVSVGNRQSSAVSGYNLPFTGEMDDVRIYSRALKLSEIQTIYAVAAPFAPVVYRQPGAATNFVTTSVTLAPFVDGSEPLVYQWLKDNNPLPGATNQTLVLANLQLANAGAYALTATNTLGSTNTAPAVVTVLPVAFTGLPQVDSGNFQVSFAGPPNAAYSVYASPDLNLPFDQWTLIASGNFDAAGAANVVDSGAAANPQQFYRITSP